MNRSLQLHIHKVSYIFEQRVRGIFVILLSVFLTSFAAYMFFVVSSLSSGFSFQHIQKDIHAVEARIAQLEADRISYMKAADLSMAKEHGYQDIVPSRYIAKNDRTEKFSLRPLKAYEE